MYITEIAKVYDEVVPFRIKTVSLDTPKQTQINTHNYFSLRCNQENAVIPYCKPGTKTLITYRL
jgi:hypothetical protein